MLSSIVVVDHRLEQRITQVHRKNVKEAFRVSPARKRLGETITKSFLFDGDTERVHDRGSLFYKKRRSCSSGWSRLALFVLKHGGRMLWLGACFRIAILFCIVDSS